MEANILSLLQSSNQTQGQKKEAKGSKTKQVKHQVEYAKRQFPLSKEQVKPQRAN
jgi:hypothetical protein